MSAEDAVHMDNWGFNFVRLGVLWDAHETKPDVWDSEYLPKMEKIINMLGEKGIYTLIGKFL
jgi:aryl-phospho-beta-D-glucosidase BglC (GH1 family)